MPSGAASSRLFRLMPLLVGKERADIALNSRPELMKKLCIERFNLPFTDDSNFVTRRRDAESET
jgi:hypothetical protein